MKKGTFKISFASDDTNETVVAVKQFLEDSYEVSYRSNSDNWVEISRAVGSDVVGGKSWFGILMCWTGTGTAIAANKIKGVRAAQASDAWTAEKARRWNDANILTLSLKRLAPDVAVECVRAFLAVREPDLNEIENIRLIE